VGRRPPAQTSSSGGQVWVPDSSAFSAKRRGLHLVPTAELYLHYEGLAFFALWAPSFLLSSLNWWLDGRDAEVLLLRISYGDSPPWWTVSLSCVGSQPWRSGGDCILDGSPICHTWGHLIFVIILCYLCVIHSCLCFVVLSLSDGSWILIVFFFSAIRRTFSTLFLPQLVLRHPRLQ